MFFYDESQDLLVFSNTFPFFFTTCSNPIDDIAQEIINLNNDSINNSLDHSFSLSFFSSNLESQSNLIYHGNHDEQTQPGNSPNLEIDHRSPYLSVLDGPEVKNSEECQMGIVFDNTYNNNHEHYVPQSHSNGDDDAESAAASEIMQRSSSCNSFDGNSGNSVPYEVAHCETLMMNSPSFQWNPNLSSLEDSFFTGQLRRVFGAGDLQNPKTTHMFQTEEANFNKVRRYSPEERNEKISKYRAKRSKRKFNKTIKYACRKTLADNRARIRGRFARNDDATVIIPKAQYSAREDNEYEFWIDLIEGLNEEI